MTNKEFIEYLGITGQLNLNDKSFRDDLDTIMKCDTYLGEQYLKFKKLGMNYDNIVMFLTLSIERFKKEGIIEALELCLKLLNMYKYYVSDNIEKYSSSILRDMILLLNDLDREYFINKTILINPKGVKMDSKFYNIDIESKEMGESEFRWFLKMWHRNAVDTILCKNGKHYFIRFEDDKQLVNLRNLVERNKDYDLLLIGYYTKSYDETKERVRKILKGVMYD